jgi:hypothetical protein
MRRIQSHMVDSEVTCGCQRAGFRQEIDSAQRQNGMVSRASFLNGGFRLDVAGTRLRCATRHPG